MKSVIYKWVRLSKETPPKEGWYLVYDKKRGVMQARFTDISGRGQSTSVFLAYGLRLLENVTHWCELPEKPVDED